MARSRPGLSDRQRGARAARPPDVEQLSAEVDAIGERAGAEVGVAIGQPGAPAMELGSLRSGAAWSTIKVPIAERVLDDAGGPSGLSADQQSNITAALTLSDNEAAASLFDGLVNNYGSTLEASEAVGEMLGEAGDTQTCLLYTSDAADE